MLIDSLLKLRADGHKITCILTAKEAPEYSFSQSDFREFARRFDIPFANGSKIVNHLDFLIKSKADIAISINYPGIIPQEIIDIFSLGILNAHGGDLPRYRGNACQAWAILNGEKQIGLCVHKMIGGELDSGDIIARSYFEIDIDTKITSVYHWMKCEIPALFSESLGKLSGDKHYFLEKQSRDPNHTLHCYPRKPEDGKIDWNESAENILRLINASNKPFQGAFCFFKETKMIIWDAFILENSNEKICAIPGQITKIKEEYVEVACGIGRIRILKVEYQGDVSNLFSLASSIRDRLC